MAGIVDISKLTEGKNLTEIEDTVLRYMISHMDSMLKMGVRGVAKENFTSTSTIMRLTKKLGYNGFVDMYYKLLPLVEQAQDHVSTDLQFINSFCSNSILKYNSYEDIKEFARRLCQLKSGYVFLYATGFSAIPLEYLTKKLLVLGIKCIYSNGMDSIGVFENNLEHMEMLVVVSRSGETRWVADRVKTAAENGIYTVSFTNEAKNRVSSMTDMQFRIEDSNKLDDRNMMANTFFPNVIMLMELLIYEYHKVLQNMDEK
ncbi:MurR/RpiR family transcriptional regulator [Lacrimispora sp. 38-1]|uniref:MurR/RpiR family transcriptional regulator n=1 Tax=Lacrimispora sp. 38-1 TaxID=3125778 RepID=UPI003CE7D205